MKQENLKKCITLIGPSSVGKSLLTPVLSKKLGMPYISIDDLLVMLSYEIDGLIGPEPKKQKEFFLYVIDGLMEDKDISKQLKDPATRPHIEAMVKNFIKEYNKVVKLLGDLKPYHKIADKYFKIISASSDPDDYIKNLTNVSAELLDKILTTIDQPIIIDAPAPFGWHMEEMTIPTRAQKIMKKYKFTTNMERCKRVYSKVIKDTTTVFLTPGADYEERNGARRNKPNRLILKDLKAYEDSAKITVTMNGLFYDPKNPALRVREWFNESNVACEALKNNPEVKQVCEQIIELRKYLVPSAGLEL